MKPAVTKLIELNLKKDQSEQFFHDVPKKDLKEISDLELSNDFKEAITILGLDQPAFSFSQDYGWMIETTKQILLNDGIEYFRKNVLSLMRAWDKYIKT